MIRDTLDRRNFIGAATTATIAALAGCTGNGGGNGGGDTDTETETSDTGGSDGGDVPSEVEEYLSDVDNFEGSFEDMTGQSEVTVEVGVEANGGNFGFGPPAIRVDSGTTVVWEWTGDGGQHDVVDEDGGFESELSEEPGHTFEQTFEESGATRYYCTPHKSLGMKGAIIAE